MRLTFFKDLDNYWKYCYEIVSMNPHDFSDPLTPPQSFALQSSWISEITGCYLKCTMPGFKLHTCGQTTVVQPISIL